MTLMLDELEHLAASEKERQRSYRHHIRVCEEAGCLSCGSGEVKEALAKEISHRGMDNLVEVKGVGCLGLCTAGPLVQIDPGGITMGGKSAMIASPTHIATTWLDGCSGCHMSLLDIDELLVELAEKIELVYGPLVDALEFPEDVDVTLVEGGVSTEEDARKIMLLRKHSRIPVSFGDCAVTANVPGMRNEFTVEEVLQRSYLENVSSKSSIASRLSTGCWLIRIS